MGLWSCSYGQETQRASIVETDHLEAKVSSNEPRAGNAMGASCLQATLVLIPCKSQPGSLFRCQSFHLLQGTVDMKMGKGGRTNHPERVAWASEAGKAEGGGPSNCFWVQGRR